jgi:sulfur carrier protein ThiS
MAEMITVNIRFYTGTEKETNLEIYDFAKGVDFQVKKGTRLRTILKEIGFKKRSLHTFFRDSERIHTLTKLRHGDRISCLTSVGGG